MDVCVYNARSMGQPAHREYRGAGLPDGAHLPRRLALCISVEFQELEVRGKGNDRSERNVANHASNTEVDNARLPCENDLRRAADILNSGKRTVILAGRGALRATDELEQTAERLAAPIVKALLGKAAVPDDGPYTTGSIGLLGMLPSQEAMEDCDAILIAGSSFPYIEISAQARPGPGCPDRSGSGPDRASISDRSRAGGRLPPVAPGVVAILETYGNQRHCELR
jgi:pyruvate dehydrogenase (quinone)